MSGPTILHRPHMCAHGLHPLAPQSTFEATGLVVDTRNRRRVWDLAPNLHCSVIGTCLTTGDLRQLFAKLDFADARAASDHTLHGRAVTAAGRNDVAGKLLNKMLDKRHEAPIKRFARATTVEEVRVLWQEALERGDIPGAYWAVFTHPATDRTLLNEAFGEVHMLSHLVGMSNRADIARLRVLEAELGARDEKIARQETRLRQAALEKAGQAARIEELEAGLRLRAVRTLAQSAPVIEEGEAVLKGRLADEQEHSRALAARAEELAHSLKASEETVGGLSAEIAALRSELAALETGLVPAADAAGEPALDLTGMRLLYVGGRPKLIEQLRFFAKRHGGELIDHDGGIEDKAGLLPGLISQADVVYFPVDCISHRAAEQVKRVCRQLGKTFAPLRSASLASFIAALGAGAAEPETERAG